MTVTSNLIFAKMASWRVGLRLLGVGFFIAGAIFLGVFTGLWLDEIFDMNILWLVGLVIGMAIAGVGVYRLLLSVLNDSNRRGS